MTLWSFPDLYCFKESLPGIFQLGTRENVKVSCQEPSIIDVLVNLGAIGSHVFHRIEEADH